MTIDAAAVADAVRTSRKYRHLCRPVVERAARWAVLRSRSEKDAVKRAKRHLHQVHGAYLAEWQPAEVGRLLDDLASAPEAAALRAACREVLPRHASTRERLPIVEEFHRQVFAVTGLPESILDLGCGLHPFELPWMGLPATAAYEAWDIDGRVVSLVKRFFGLAWSGGRAFCADVLSAPPAHGADVAFLLKMLPCLEQQERGCSRRLIENLAAAFVVVSFPTASLGGRPKGMARNYSESMDRILADLPWPAMRIGFSQETVYVIRKA